MISRSGKVVNTILALVLITILGLFVSIPAVAQEAETEAETTSTAEKSDEEESAPSEEGPGDNLEPEDLDPREKDLKKIDPSKKEDKASLAAPMAMAMDGGGEVSEDVSTNKELSPEIKSQVFIGSAGYSIPIAVPPGRQGVAPKLALSYNSYRGNGWAGVGWGLSLDAIQRSTRLGLNYSANDYVHGSAELVQRDDWGTNYFGKKIEQNFSKYYYDETDGWVVTARDGIRYFYGQTVDSRQDNGLGTFKWCLDRVEDTNGNYMTISYTKLQGQIYPDQIDYTAHTSGLAPINYVKFHYNENVSDAPPMYSIKSQVITSKRLKTIEVRADGEAVRAYYLTYATSVTKKLLLEKVELYGSDAAVDQTTGDITGGSIFRTMDFQYQGSAPGTFTKKKTSIDNTGSNIIVRVGDFTGDGKSDILAYKDGEASVYRGENNGLFTYLDPNENLPGPLAIGDFSGDGKTDILTSSKLYRSNGNGRFTDLNTSFPGVGLADVQTGDFNGDGETDIITYSTSGTSGWYVLLSNGSGGFSNAGHIAMSRYENSSVAGDFNGDGRSDFLTRDSNQWKIYLANQNGALQYASAISGAPASLQPHSHPASGDFNGDGNSDLILLMSDGDTNAYLSKGDGTFVYSSRIEDDPIGYVRIGDFNGDKRDDLLYCRLSSSENWRAFLSDGDGTFTYIYEPYDELYDGVPSLGDFNGDGKMDFTTHDGLDNDHRRVFIANTENAPAPDLLLSVSNGIGGTTTVEYTPSTRYSNTNLQMVLHTVSTIRVNDGISPDSVTQYSYSGGYYDRATREFRGFGYAQKTNPDQSYSEVWFHQDEYRQGLSYQTEFRDPGDPGTLLVKTTSQFEIEYLDVDETYGFVKLTQTRTEYEGDENLYSQKDYTYDSTNGFLISTLASGTDAENIATEGEYINYGEWLWRQTRSTLYDSGSNRVRESYSEYESGTGNLLSQERWLDGGTNPSAHFTYDNYGNIATQADARGNTTTTIYDTLTHIYPIRITAPETNGIAHIVEYEEYDYRYGAVKTAKDENGNRTYYNYDVFGRKLSTDFPDGGRTEVEYHDDVFPRYVKSRILEDDDPVSYVEGYKYYDGLNRTIQTLSFGEDNKSIVTQFRYDNMGRQDRVDGPFFADVIGWPIDVPADQPYTETTYDFRGRPLTIVTPHGEYGMVLTAYTYQGFSMTVTDPDQSQKTQKKDHLDRIIQMVEHADQGQQNTYYAYNVAGDMLTITNHLGHVMTMGYNTLGKKINMDDPDMGFWQYTYDPNGNMLTQTDAKGQIITYAYDELNRPTLKTYSTPDPTVTYEYDNPIAVNGCGRLYSTSNNDVVETINSYDEMGRPTSVSKTISGNATTYTTETVYDLSGKRISIIYPDSYQVNYTCYPGTNLLESVDGITDMVNYAKFEEYEPTGKIGVLYHGNGTQTAYVYDSKSTRLISIETKDTGFITLIQKKEYKYTRAGDIKEIHNGINEITYQYTYDKLHRLISEVNNGPNNNIYPASIQSNYTDDAPVHTLKTAVFNQAEFDYEYDENGNMASGPDYTDPLAVALRNITYNADNMPVSIEHSKGGNTTVIDLLYDGEERRAKKAVQGGGTTYYISNDFEVINGDNTKYIFAGNLRIAKVTSSEILFFHKDHLGSSTVMTEYNNGDTLETSDYMPFGHMRVHTGSVKSDYKFTDQEFDSKAGLYNYDSRLYDPIIGNFIIADSIIPNIYNPQFLNRYSYCYNNPLKYIDPDGHIGWEFSDTYGYFKEGVEPNNKAKKALGWGIATEIVRGLSIVLAIYDYYKEYAKQKEESEKQQEKIEEVWSYIAWEYLEDDPWAGIENADPFSRPEKDDDIPEVPVVELQVPTMGDRRSGQTYMDSYWSDDDSNESTGSKNDSGTGDFDWPGSPY